MICPRCLHRITTTSSRPLRPLRPFSTTARLLFPASAPNLSTQNSPRGPPSGTHEGPPAALSTSAAQPLSSPLSPAPTSVPHSGEPSPAAAAPRSSVAAGTVLKGLSYVKGQDAPLAQEDSAYPDWLWGLLNSKLGKGKSGAEEGEGEGGDLYSKSKKQRRLASKRAALLASSAALNPSHRKIPLEQQSVDLPGGDGTVAGAIGAAEAREEVREAMRRGRRRGIKEGNFLKGMR